MQVPPDSFERCACSLCGSHETGKNVYRFGDFTVVRCESCGVWYLSPRLREAVMREYYERSDYFEGGIAGYDNYDRQEQSLRATFRRLLRHLESRGLTGGALLDVGCGYGYFLDEAKPFFAFRAGVEMSPAAAAKAECRADKIYRGDIETLPKASRFDAVVGLQLIEHVYHPRKFLENLLCHVVPGGVVLLTTPHMGSFWRRTMGRRWPSFKLPEHVVFYDCRTLPGLMRGVGLCEVAEIEHPHAFPLAEILAKLGLPVIPGLAKYNVWLPSVALAIMGRKAGRDQP